VAKTLDDLVIDDPVYLVEMVPRRTDGTPAAPVYLATRDITLPHDDPAAPSRQYLGGLIEALAREVDLFAVSDGADGGDDVTLGGPSSPRPGSIVLAPDMEVMAEDLPVWRTLAWDGAAVRVRRGPYGGRLNAFETVHQGVLSGDITEGADGIEWQVLGLDGAFDQVLNDTAYGPGGLEGQPKPIAVGRFQGFAPVLVDAAEGWWDVSPLTGLDRVDRVEDGGFGIARSFDSPPPDGHYYAHLEGGRIQFRGRPQFGLRVSGVSGYAGGATAAGPLLDHLLDEGAGVPVARGMDVDALPAWPLGTATREALRIRDLADLIVTSVGGYYADAPGVGLAVGRLRAPDAADADEADLYLDDQDIERGSLAIRRPGAPPHTLRVGHAPTLDPLSEDRIAADAPAGRRAALTRDRAYTAWASAAARARRRLAGTASLDTALAEAGDAEALAAGHGALLTADHELVEVAVPVTPFRLPLMAEVWLSSAAHGLDAAYRLLGVRESAADSVVRLKLWRPR